MQSSLSYSSSQSLRGFRTSGIRAHKTASVYGGLGGAQVSQNFGGSRLSLGIAGGGGQGYGSGTSYSFSASGGGGGGGGGAFGAFGGGGGGFGASESALSFNEKLTMQNLNERLATYLEKVRSLEAANIELERKIREFHINAVGPTAQDYSHFEKIILELRGKILDATVFHANMVLCIDNAKLTADDFRVKYESELTMRQGVEADIIGLRKLLDDMTLSRANLEMEIESLKDELIHLRKNHEEELQIMRSQLSGQVNVEVDAAPSTDLLGALEDLRQQYSAIAEKNQKAAEATYLEQSAEVTKEVNLNAEAIQAYQTQINDLKHTIQGLELELQTLLSIKASLEGNLAETEASYSAQLHKLQLVIMDLEAQLLQIREEIGIQSNEYNLLLDIKTRLEMEIATYRRLLDGEESSSQMTLISNTTLKSSALSTTTTEDEDANSGKVSKKVRVKTIVQEIEDGRVVGEKETYTEQEIESGST
ncbi:keratin, type I cytoskeletal 19-like [Latimeria chalumnae]|uniref:keratin, type I cytoskeletal 19-like n=1 Tax=Latimeria chalumnae TaxID=7897 RepID=UPI0003C1A186|nr:PREDICTED: keratin, type I cytoskeletal 19-like [Latimeria chalumnae]|eukprot:XP_006000597.1 PREDICTED: keratin, type I cytoskeletal 19-like [Latimeria chalumnae]